MQFEKESRGGWGGGGCVIFVQTESYVGWYLKERKKVTESHKVFFFFQKEIYINTENNIKATGQEMFVCISNTCEKTDH